VFFFFFVEWSSQYNRDKTNLVLSWNCRGEHLKHSWERVWHILCWKFHRCWILWWRNLYGTAFFFFVSIRWSRFWVVFFFFCFFFCFLFMLFTPDFSEFPSLSMGYTHNCCTYPANYLASCSSYFCFCVLCNYDLFMGFFIFFFLNLTARFLLCKVILGNTYKCSKMIVGAVRIYIGVLRSNIVFFLLPPLSEIFLSLFLVPQCRNWWMDATATHLLMGKKSYLPMCGCFHNFD